MNIRTPLRTAIIGLKSKKTRTFLTMLGIVIGITSVIVIISVGAGAQSLVINQIKGFGSNLITIFPGASEEDGPPPAVLGSINTDLKIEDMEALMDEKNAPNIIGVTYFIRGIDTMQWQSNQYEGTYVGTTASYPEVQDAKVEFGRFLDLEEEKNLAKVVVLGYQAAEELFAGTDPIGKTIKIKKQSFKVIGVMEKRGTVGFENQDVLSFIPISTGQKIMLGVDYLSFGRVKVDNEENIERVIGDIRAILRERHGLDTGEVDDFSARAQAQAIDVFSSVTDSLTYFLAAIAAISLLVGGIGIMNIMLITVTERTREIGLRKAIGAKNKNILSQFIIESVFLTFVGGIIGIIIGVLISWLVAFIAQRLGYDWDFVVSFFSVFLSTGIALLVGLIFGIYPALKASKLNPIEALRYE